MELGGIEGVAKSLLSYIYGLHLSAFPTPIPTHETGRNGNSEVHRQTILRESPGGSEWLEDEFGHDDFPCVALELL